MRANVTFFAKTFFARLCAGVFGAVLITCLAGGEARAQSLIADLSNHHVAITTGFTGAEVLLFGTVDGPGDIIVVISGPREPVVVRRKKRIAGVWTNASRVGFEGVPNFYALAATRPLAEIASPDALSYRQIGQNNLQFERAAEDRDRSRREVAEFRAALFRNKQNEGLYTADPAAITVLSDRLFRTDIRFPANMATGFYSATVYLFRDGEMVQAVNTPMLVEKVGIGAQVYTFAHTQSALYGLAAIAAAVAAGWLAGAVFRSI